MKRISIPVITLLFLAVSVLASGPQVWTVDSRSDILKGDADGVSIGDDGRLTIAPKLDEIFSTGESFILSSAMDAAGSTYLGTGPNGKLFRVDASGKGSLLADLAELNVSAVAAAPNGDVFAATMPDGKVYRIDRTGAASVYFDPKAKYIWALAVLPTGELAVATGDAGKIYKVKAAGASPESSLLYDSEEMHIVSLVADRSGNLYAGTDPNGILLRISPDGKAFALLDSPLRELHTVAAAPDGSIYALAIAESASTVKAADAATPAEEKKNDKPVKVAKPTAAAETSKSDFDLAKAKTAVYHIQPDGTTDLVWAPEDVVGFSLAAIDGGVLVGTSDKGRVYKITNDRRETLFLQTPAGQISNLLAAGSRGFLAAASNQGTLFGFGTSGSNSGTYSSPVLDAGTTASWGRLRWRSSGAVSIQTRSGNTEIPNNTWSDWSAEGSDQKGFQVASPKARYFQWRAILKNAGASLSSVSLAFLARNSAPEVTSLVVLPTNVGLAPNPAGPVDPNIELAGLDPALFGLPSTAAPPRRLYQRGALSLQWTANDENDDTLVYDVYFRAVGETAWRELKAGITDTFLTVDGQSFADGQYVFKVVARDSVSNPTQYALSGERMTETVEIDNTPPTIAEASPAAVTNGIARISFVATDAASYISRAEYSVNAGDWKPIYPQDGIADSSAENFVVEVAAGKASAVTIRVFDANGNSGNYRVLVK
ncbi:MAG: YD repeat-containing protein [Acidobacteria bacterium OLB17]|nr:MAG: YD repeat-containing protein [Acidobacteria bacterium OLB17]MCZ2391340.1 hypothetical protein [Acidobacteriota bacterium]